MGLDLCEVKQKVETVRLWCRLRNMPVHRTMRRVHEWSFLVGRSWEQKMLKFIDNHNLREQMLTGSPNKPHCVTAARTCLIESDRT